MLGCTTNNQKKRYPKNVKNTERQILIELSQLGQISYKIKIRASVVRTIDGNCEEWSELATMIVLMVNVEKAHGVMWCSEKSVIASSGVSRSDQTTVKSARAKQYRSLDLRNLATRYISALVSHVVPLPYKWERRNRSSEDKTPLPSRTSPSPPLPLLPPPPPNDHPCSQQPNVDQRVFIERPQRRCVQGGPKCMPGT